MTISITAKAGIANSVTKDFNTPVTPRQVLNAPGVKAILNVGDNVLAYNTEGSQLPMDGILPERNQTIRFETAAASKASR